MCRGVWLFFVFLLSYLCIHFLYLSVKCFSLVLKTLHYPSRTTLRRGLSVDNLTSFNRFR